MRGAAALTLVLAGCTAAPSVAPPASFLPRAQRVNPGLRAHAIIGFSVDTPKRAATAASEGVNTTILYGGAPSRHSALETALRAYSIDVVNGAISSLLFYWECHRTHTVKPPPGSYAYDYYCRTDENPRIKDESVVLRDAGALLDADARRDYVTGYWVLDDWPGWDPGSGRELLRKIHSLILAKTPGRAAICGFGAGIARPGRIDWDPGTAANYSDNGCDVVGWYNYSPFGRRHPSLGKRLDWSMKALLPAMRRSLAKYGWKSSTTPLYGIGQAWGGSYEKRYYQPGLTSAEMRDQANAFCAFGATYIGWYAWNDSGFEARTQTPNNSKAVADGIAAGISVCRDRWR